MEVGTIGNTLLSQQPAPIDLPDSTRPRNERHADEEESSHSGIYSSMSKNIDKSTNKEKIPVHRRPPVRILNFCKSSAQANPLSTVKEKSHTQSLEESITCQNNSDSFSLMKMPDSDTFTATLNAEINTPIHHSSQKRPSTDLLGSMEWLLESGIRNRHLLRKREQQLIDGKIDHNRLYETPGKGLCNDSDILHVQTQHNVTNDGKKPKQDSLYKMSSSNRAFVTCKSVMHLKYTHNSAVNTPKNRNALNIWNNSSASSVNKVNTFIDVVKPLKHLDEHETLKNSLFEKQSVQDANSYSRAEIIHNSQKSTTCSVDQHKLNAFPKTHHQTPMSNENKENEVRWMPQIENISNKYAAVEPLNLKMTDGAKKNAFVPKIGSLTEEYVPEAIVTSTKHSVPNELSSESNHPLLKSTSSYVFHHPVLQGFQADVKNFQTTTPKMGTITPDAQQTPKPNNLLRPCTPHLPQLEKKNEHPVQFKQPDAGLERNRVMFSMPVAKPPPNYSLMVNHKTYTILSKLGKGGSSIVYQVMDSEKKMQLAIKCVQLGNVDRETAQGYMNEVQILKKLQKCDTVIRLFDYEYLKNTQTLMVVMEKGDVDLSNLLRNINKSSKISIHMIVYYWTEMLNAVKSIHENGIIHSDLKPANFLFVSGRLKLIDFGIASSLNKDVTSVIKETTLGTFNYMSPEAIGFGLGKSGGLKISFKSDIWSLGCILYNLVYGRTPFAEIVSNAFKLQVISDPSHVIKFPPLTDYPNMLITIMKCCLTFNPKDRPTAAELLQHPYLPRMEDPLKMEKIRNVVTPEVWETIQQALS